MKIANTAMCKVLVVIYICPTVEKLSDENLRMVFRNGAAGVGPQRVHYKSEAMFVQN